MDARILIVGDLHFSARSLPLLELLKEKILCTIDDLKPDHVVFLGDTHDRFGSINSTRSKEVTLFFYQVSIRVPFTLLVGNHDIPNKTLFYCEDHDFTAMKFYWKNTLVVDKCTTFEVNGYKFGAVAYCPNGRLLEGLEPARPFSQLSAVFCHQEMRGCDINGLPSKEGDRWHRSWCPIFCGHIHLHHACQANVHYVGSPYQDNFGENDDKSISLVTFSGREWKEERIYLDLPKKIKMEMTMKTFLEWEPEAPHLYSLSLSGTDKECRAVRETEMYKRMTRDGNKVAILPTIFQIDRVEQTQTTREPERRTLKAIIAESIQGKDYLFSIHNEVFPQQ